MAQYISGSTEAAAAAGLTYDGYCMWDIVTNESICHEFESGTFLGCDDDCQIYHGALAEGEPCEAYGHRMSDCQQGLVCAPDRTCHWPCDYSFTAPENGYCGPARGMWFVTCDAGLACNDEGTCQPAPAVGEACDVSTACAIGGWCDEGVCAEDLEGGSPCTDHDQCVSDYCREGTCFTPASSSPACGRWAW